MPVKPSRSRIARATASTPAPLADQIPDPLPLSPREPALEDCCQSGCTPCIFDLYQDALERYRIALQAWQLRHDGGAG